MSKDYLNTIYRLNKESYSLILIAIGELNIGDNYDELFELIGTEFNIPNKIDDSVLQPTEEKVCILF
jgi:hypothetical protein